MPRNVKATATTKTTITAVFTALVCVATMVFTIYVPSTRGFFNIGETMVYIAALLFGPFVGAFAGGVGSMFADILLGYYYYAPATLVIKALEGGLVGFLNRKKHRFSESHTKREWKIFTAEIGVLIGALVSLIGFLYYSGIVEFYSGVPPPETPTSTIFIPVEFWFGLGVFVTLLIAAVAFISEPEFGWMVISTIFGGLLMVAGYFLYEQLFLGVFALAEVPVNIGQMTIGLIVATPIVKVIQRTLPQLKS
ncbi:MAG: ECF transporter S component [Candidatus Bathyarchaeales archaeon]